MLNYNSLASKPEISRMIDGKKVTYKDLLCNTLSDEEPVFDGIEFIRVTDDYVARPDLISLAVYGTDQYADILCKINGISNPFELNEDMVIYIPSKSDIDNILYKSGEGACELIESDSSIKKKLSVYTKKKTDARSPSMAVIGDTNYVIDKSSGLVFY